jgi:hypothetical protein
VALCWVMTATPFPKIGSRGVVSYGRADARGLPFPPMRRGALPGFAWALARGARPSMFRLGAGVMRKPGAAFPRPGAAPPPPAVGSTARPFFWINIGV